MGLMDGGQDVIILERDYLSTEMLQSGGVPVMDHLEKTGKVERKGSNPQNSNSYPTNSHPNTFHVRPFLHQETQGQNIRGTRAGKVYEGARLEANGTLLAKQGRA